MTKKILLICGLLSKTTIMHQISVRIQKCNYYFIHYYADGFLDRLSEIGFLDFAILVGRFKKGAINYFLANKLNIDFGGNFYNYDLAST
ncbi:MAG: hypothetical protein M1480_04360 [Bacteroidetes bacterium]|nr:hypothetical protein [Bacteroidota bacterium]